MRPDGRREQILMEEVGEELVIYDLQRHRVHQLNKVAAMVWMNCNGRKTIPEIRKVLQKEISPAVDEAIVWKALDRLGKVHLLQKPVSPPASVAGMTRRQMLRKFGTVAALALLAPVVTSIVAPTPVQALPIPSCFDAYCRFLGLCTSECTGNGGCAPPTPFCVVRACQTANSFCAGCKVGRCGATATSFKIGPGGF
jgi:hypothetical protein